MLVHDAARPFVSDALITRAIAAARSGGAAVPAIAVADTVKTVDAHGAVTGTHRSSASASCADAAGVRLRGPAATRIGARRRPAARISPTMPRSPNGPASRSTTFEGEAANVKLTTNEDFARAEAAKLAALGDVRTGFGFDVHQFGDGDHVMLGGVRIPHQRGLSGHSDADVVLHALVDAILGALADGDIGVHFPPSDPQWRGASSDRFLAFAVERVRARGGRIAHLDVTDRVRGAAHRPAPRCHACAHRRDRAACRSTRVGVKATTSEKMGFTGRGEGMAAFANATVRLPWSE